MRQLRSAAAEWALINREAVRSHLPLPYVEGMRKAARKQIGEAAAVLEGNGSPAKGVAQALLALPPDADSGLLSRHAAALKQIEDRLESA